MREQGCELGSKASQWELSDLALGCSEWARLYVLLTAPNLLKNTNMFEGNSDVMRGDQEWKRGRAMHHHAWDVSGPWAFETHSAEDFEPDPNSTEDFATLLFRTRHIVTSHTHMNRSQKIKGLEALQVLAGRCGVKLLWDVWVSSRFDCGSSYAASLDMPLNNDVSKRRKTMSLETCKLKAEANNWLHKQAAVDLTPLLLSNPLDMRNLEYKEGGHDNNQWGGFYGVKIYNARIRVECVGPLVGRPDGDET
jgi:hypothetical protein